MNPHDVRLCRWRCQRTRAGDARAPRPRGFQPFQRGERTSEIANNLSFYKLSLSGVINNCMTIKFPYCGELKPLSRLRVPLLTRHCEERSDEAIQ
jgi:hypothetical protein